MLDRVEFEPVFFAPFVSSVMKVEPQWIDYNGHLNLAYYNILFNNTMDEMFDLAGVGEAYMRGRGCSLFAAETHVRYLRELRADVPVRVTFQLLDYDAKRMHFFLQLFHAAEGWVSATMESLSLHVNMQQKKTVPFPDDIAARLKSLKCSHARLPMPEAIGRRIAIPR